MLKKSENTTSDSSEKMRGERGGEKEEGTGDEGKVCLRQETANGTCDFFGS